MTVVVWDGTTLAADRMAVVAGRIYTVRKLYRIDADRLAAFSGLGNHGMAVVEWLRAGGAAAAFPKPSSEGEGSTVLVVHRDGRLFRYEEAATPIEVLDQVHALGSGADFALAALTCGKSAREAVEITNRWSADCGEGVDVMTFEDLTTNATPTGA